MPNLTSNFSFNKPLVNDPIDEDLWGGQLNSNWDSVDTILDALTPIGTVQAYTDTSAPNSRWLLAFGQAVSRTTYSALFSLVSTSFGVGDGSTTFNLPDCRGRAIVGLDNLGGSSADRITDANADSLNNTGVGDETEPTLTGTTGGTAITQAQVPSYNLTIPTQTTTGAVGTLAITQGNAAANNSVSISSGGSGQAHTHDAGSLAGSTGGNIQPSIALGAIIRVL